MLKIGLIGAGTWGKNYIRALNNTADVELVKIARKSGKSVDGFDNIPVTSNYFDILNDKDIDAVVIATPYKEHYHAVRDSLINGKHVLVEKPFTASVDDATALVNLARIHQRMLMVGHLQLFNPAIIKMKEIMQNSKWGELVSISSKRLSFNDGKDALWEMFPHDVYTMHYLLDKDPTKVIARGPNYYQHIHMEYDNIPVSVELSTLYPVKIRHITVYFENGMLFLDDTKGAEDKLCVINVKGERLDIPVNKIDLIEMQLHHFIFCIKNNLISDGSEGLENVKIIEGAQDDRLY